MKKLFFIFLLCLFFFEGKSQESPLGTFQGDAQIQSVLSTDNQLPFWLWANNMGMIKEDGQAHQLGVFRFNGDINFGGTTQNQLFYGTNISGELTNKSHMQLNELFVGYHTRLWTFMAGRQAYPIQTAGLSSTNADLYASNNARPYPKVSLGTNGYLKLFGPFSFRAIYEEAFMRDNQYEVVRNAHLHHKNLYFKYDNGEGFSLSAGLDHYVWWGGTMSNGQKLPSGLKDYLRYIFSKNGNSDFLQTDQLNAAGNSLGQYKIELNKKLNNSSLQVYICHPYEDGSGLHWKNFQDNLIGVWIKKDNQKSLFEDVVAEFYYTMNQSGSPYARDENGQPIQSPTGGDNYFNNGVYGSGYTYYGNMIGSPLFYPVVYNANGKVAGFSNNRFWALHLGLDGQLSEEIRYKMLATWSHNKGTYGNPYPETATRFNSMAEIFWQPRNCRVQFNGSVGFDHNQIPYTSPLNSNNIAALSLGIIRRF